jgi:excinuclease UvrABC ATPase subunit
LWWIKSEWGVGLIRLWGTITDISTVLRLLFSKIGQTHLGARNLFSFNDPQGMCPECNGIGRKLGVKSDGFWDMDKSLNEGAIQVPVYSAWERDTYVTCGFFDNDKKLRDYTPEEMDLLLYGKDIKFKTQMGNNSINLSYEGVIERFTRAYIRRDLKTLSERTQKAVAPYITMQPCPLCHGARLSQAALNCRINGYNIAELSAMEVGDLLTVVQAFEDKSVAPILVTLRQQLQHLVDIGLEYLSSTVRPAHCRAGNPSE